MTPTRGLGPLHERILDELAGMQPPWTLFGAGALIGFYLHHRSTRDLDLAFRAHRVLGEIPREVEARLVTTGLVEDIGALLDAGGDLDRGLVDAAAKDGGFSAPTLAWLVHGFPVERAADEGRDQARIEAVRDRLLTALRS